MGTPITFMPRSDQGRLIVLCGTDGVGKTSIMSGIADASAARGWRVTQLKQPTPELRKDEYFRRLHAVMESDPMAARAAVMMSMADRVVSCTETVLPRLAAGETVVIDRYVFSGLARLLLWDPDSHHAWFAEACRLLPRPDHMVLLVSDEDVIAKRLADRDHEDTSAAAMGRVLNVQRALRTLAKENDMTVIDTSAMTIEQALATLFAHVDAYETKRPRTADRG